MRVDEWYVAFVRSPNRGIYRMFGRTDHVFAFGRLGLDGWVLVEASMFGLDLMFLDEESHRLLWGSVMREGRLYRAKPQKRKPVWLPEIATCVGAVKGLLNIRCFWTITPKQLEAELVRFGAERVA